MRYRYNRIFREKALDEKKMKENHLSIPKPGEAIFKDAIGTFTEVLDLLANNDENRCYVVYEEIDD